MEIAAAGWEVAHRGRSVSDLTHDSLNLFVMEVRASLARARPELFQTVEMASALAVGSGFVC